MKDQNYTIVKVADLFWVTGVPATGKSHMMKEFINSNNLPNRVLAIDLDSYGYWSEVQTPDGIVKDIFVVDFDPVIIGLYKKYCWSYDAIVLFGICDNLIDIVKANYITGVFNINTPADTIARRLDARAEIYEQKDDEGAKNFLASLNFEDQSRSRFISKCIEKHELQGDHYIQIVTVKDLFDGILARCSLLVKYMADEFKSDWGKNIQSASVVAASEFVIDENKWSQNGKK